MSRPKRLLIDFDGVLHSYTSPWVSATHIPDPPVIDPFTGRSAISWLAELIEATDEKGDRVFEVCIFSTRCAEADAESAIVHWLEVAGLPPAHVAELRFTHQKLPAWLSVDDRCLRFEGAFPPRHELEAFVPWNRQPPIAPSRLRIHQIKYLPADFESIDKGWKTYAFGEGLEPGDVIQFLECEPGGSPGRRCLRAVGYIGPGPWKRAQLVAASLRPLTLAEQRAYSLGRVEVVLDPHDAIIRGEEGEPVLPAVEVRTPDPELLVQGPLEHAPEPTTIERAPPREPTHFGEFFRATRKRLGATMGDVARLFGRPVAYVSDVELGITAPFAPADIELFVDRYFPPGTSPRDALALREELHAWASKPRATTSTVEVQGRGWIVPEPVAAELRRLSCLIIRHHDDNSVVTQGSFNALMAKLEGLEHREKLSSGAVGALSQKLELAEAERLQTVALATAICVTTETEFASVHSQIASGAAECAKRIAEDLGKSTAERLVAGVAHPGTGEVFVVPTAVAEWIAQEQKATTDTLNVLLARLEELKRGLALSEVENLKLKAELAGVAAPPAPESPPPAAPG